MWAGKDAARGVRGAASRALHQQSACDFWTDLITSLSLGFLVYNMEPYPHLTAVWEGSMSRGVKVPQTESSGQDLLHNLQDPVQA